MRIAGSRVLVTGAGHGLGFAIASGFGESGAEVVVTDISSERVEEAVAKLRASGRNGLRLRAGCHFTGTGRGSSRASERGARPD